MAYGSDVGAESHLDESVKKTKKQALAERFST
jgi:hypothetical protein